MQEVKVEDLEAGDEILISCQSYFKYLRLLRTPQLGKRLYWKTKLPMYKSVKCSARVDEVKQTHNWGNGNVRTWIDKKWIFTDKDHNNESYVNLEHRQILLIRKNTN